MKLQVILMRETRNFVYYESPDFENAFKTGQPAIKMWLPKSEIIVEGPEGICFPPVIEFTIGQEVVSE